MELQMDIVPYLYIFDGTKTRQMNVGVFIILSIFFEIEWTRHPEMINQFCQRTDTIENSSMGLVSGGQTQYRQPNKKYRSGI
jgi:hypothetical protein